MSLLGIWGLWQGSPSFIIKAWDQEGEKLYCTEANAACPGPALRNRVAADHMGPLTLSILSSVP